ncbi:MAG TPA: transglycosylase SLT domain-containing protein [Ramlibacter sp.]|uniref:transglycosylase SLT domain-containing protein n=1 Tax=Ramlibacter sp. TaxID=1917967 RepID=UPI002ED1D873
MKSLRKNTTARVAVSLAAVGVAALTSQVSSAQPRVALQFKAPSAAAAVAALKPAVQPAIRFAAPVVAKAGTEAALRSAIKFETVRWGGKPVQTLDEGSRILLAKAAAEKAGLGEVGLDYNDVYGVIEAETSWIQRTGSSKNGTPNLGLAQFEPRTAKAMGLDDPQDPVQAVFAAAKYMKLGAQWASPRIGHLKSDPALYAAKLREGVSVHYNLSIKGRNKWTGLNTAQLPVETQRHIRNAALGAKEAVELARLIKV